MADPEPTPEPPAPPFQDAKNMLTSIMSGDPEKMLDALPIPQETKDKMRSELASKDESLRTIASQVENMVNAIQLMARLVDQRTVSLRDTELQTQRSVELIRRALKRVPTLGDILERLEAEDREREEVAAGSAGSGKVATSPVKPKIA